MMVLALSEEDKEKLILKGAKYITSQKIGDKDTYLFDIGKMNFSLEGVNYMPTNKMYF